MSRATASSAIAAVMMEAEISGLHATPKGLRHSFVLSHMEKKTPPVVIQKLIGLVPTEMIHYGMTKTAQLSIASGLAQLTSGTGVTVNSVLPGPTYTPGVKTFVDALASERGQTREEAEAAFFRDSRPLSLLKRFITPKEVAGAVAYLCSPLAAATNGALLRVDGGIVKGMH